jgi:hypothetical protein
MRAAHLVVALLLSVTAVVHWGGPDLNEGPEPRFVAARFARLQPATPGLARRFHWPSTAEFEATYALVFQARASLYDRPLAHAWEDWTYATTLLGPDAERYRSRQWSDPPDAEVFSWMRKSIVRCYQVGDLACFLSRTLDWHQPEAAFPASVSWSALEAGRAGTRQLLAGIGVDAAKLLRGLLYQFQVPGIVRLGAADSRLAMLIHDLGLDAEMVQVLSAEAARADLDHDNRRRAAMTLAELKDLMADARRNLAPPGQWIP